MNLGAMRRNLWHNRDTFRDAVRVPNLHVLLSLLGPAARGFLRRAAKGRPATEIHSAHAVHFDWTYERDRPALARLHTAAKRSQWDAETALDWSLTVDAADPERDLLPEAHLPFADLMSDSRWDVKFLGMQIMIEGLALGAFGTIRRQTREPLLQELLRYVIADEARHVHFGVLALEECYTDDLGLLPARLRPHYEELGLLGYENLPAAPDVTAADLLED